VTDQIAVPAVEEELRIGKREVTRGGARVRSFTREEPTEQSVTLNQDSVDHETRSVERRLTREDVERGGLLKERVIEVSEMREEPVITKEAFVREEVVLTRTVTQRVETVRDTLKRTEVEVEDLAGGEAKDRPR
jgi:stress response protein YsnF